MTEHRLFGLFCLHEWEKAGECEVRRLVGLDRTKDYNWIVTGHDIILRCTHCGDYRQRRLRV